MPRVTDPPARMLAELRRLRARIEREREQWGDPTPRTRGQRDEAIVRWHTELGAGSLSLIAREAGVSRVQAGRIVRAARETEPGQAPPPTRRYYQ